MPKKSLLRREVFLIAFGVCLYCLVQNFHVVLGVAARVYHILDPIVLGLGMAFVLNVLMSSLEKPLLCMPVMRRYGALKRSISLTLTVLIALGVIAVCLLILIPRVTDMLQLLITALPRSSQMLTSTAENLLRGFNVDESVITNVRTYISGVTIQVMGLLRESSGTIANTVISTVVDALSAMLNTIFSLMIAIYVLADKERIGRFIVRMMERFLPKERVKNVADISSLSFTTFTNFVRGQVVESVILGILNFVMMLALSMPYAGPASVVVGVTHVLPILGAWIGGGIAGLLVFAAAPDKVVLFLVVYVIVQQLESNIIYPVVVGNSIGLPGLLVLCAVIVGQRLMGMVGILVAVPACAVLYTLLKRRMRTPRPTTPGFFQQNMTEPPAEPSQPAEEPKPEVAPPAKPNRTLKAGKPSLLHKK